MTVEPIAPYVEPVRKQVTVRLPPAQAFDLFTAHLDRWWPLATHSIARAEAATCEFEGAVGGEVFETGRDGTRHVWGRVITWDPPHRFVMTWHPGRAPDTAQEVEVRFLPDGSRTRVELEHRGWQRLGAEAASMRAQYDSGWDGVLRAHYAAAAERTVGPDHGGPTLTDTGGQRGQVSR